MWADGHIFTANIIWCEEKYAINNNIAEFWNSISNLPFIVLGICMLYNGLQIRVPGRFLLCYVGLAIVGIGSFLFHATLRYECQLMDEFPMMMVAAHAVFCLLTHSGTRLWTKMLWLVIIYSLISAALVAYIICNISIFFQIIFAVLMGSIIGVALRAWWMAPNRKHKGVSFAQCMITSFAFSLVGFGLWLVDVHGCHILRNMRAVLGHPWIALLQLHAWWHLLTSLGATWLIAALTLADPFQSPQFYVEPYGFIFPITCRTQVPTEIIAIRHKIE